MTAPHSGVSGSFRVDMERAPQAIRDLEDAAHQLLELRRQAVELAKVEPAARDSVSVDAATMLGAVADGGAGSLAQAIDAGLAQINGLVSSMKADLDGYASDDRSVASAFSRDGRS